MGTAEGGGRISFCFFRQSRWRRAGRSGDMLHARWGGGKKSYVRLRCCCRLLLVLMMNGWMDGWMYVVERVGWFYDSLARRVYMVLASASWSAVHTYCSVAPCPPLFYLSCIGFHALLKMCS